MVAADLITRRVLSNSSFFEGSRAGNAETGIA
jgi:hypothetical protein